MINVSIQVPSLGNFAPASAPPFDIRTIDPSVMLTKLSKDLTASDQLSIFGTLDVTATPTSPNNVLIGVVQGNNGTPSNGSFLSYWPFVLIQRTAGSTPTSPTSLFYISGSTAYGSLTAPPSTALPRLNTNPPTATVSTGVTSAILLAQTTVLTAATSIAAVSDGLSLPQSDIFVNNSTGFPSAGNFLIPQINALVSYTGLTSTIEFTGCSTTSRAAMVLNQAVVYVQILPQPALQVSTVQPPGVSFASSGSLYIPQVNAFVSYTSVDTLNNTFLGCTTTSSAMLTNQVVIQNLALPQATITVGSTTGFTPTGHIYIPAIDAFIAYTGLTATTFTGCTTTSTATLGQGQVVQQVVLLPQSTIDVDSTLNFTPIGSLYDQNSGAVIAYTGVTPTSFTGCTTTSTAPLLPGDTLAQVVTSALLNLSPFTNPVRVGLDANQTTIDTFQLYGTDDPGVASTAGGTLLASLQGGGGTNSTWLVSAYQYVYVVRTGGFTAGNLLAWGSNDL
jgi:hypothetical protein